MKSTRRHELQQNELDAELTKTLAFFKKHGTTLAWSALIIVALALLVFWFVRNRQQQEAEIASRYTVLKQRLTMNPLEPEDDVLAGFKSLIEQDRNERLAALSCVEVGDIYAARSLGASQDMQKEQEDQAKRYYERTIQQFDIPIAEARAQLGLARIAEGKRDFETAREHYQAIVGMENLPGHPIIAQAQTDLRNLENYDQPVEMAATQPATQPADTQPATQSATTQPVE